MTEWSVSVGVWVSQLRKLLLRLLQSRWSEESGVSSLLPLLQVNGFKSDRIAGLLVDFLPNRVGVFPLSLLCFLSKLKHETGGGRTHRLLQPRVTPIKLTTKKSCSLFLHRLPGWWRLSEVSLHDFRSADVREQSWSVSTNVIWTTEDTQSHWTRLLSVFV